MTTDPAGGGEGPVGADPRLRRWLAGGELFGAATTEGRPPDLRLAAAALGAWLAAFTTLRAAAPLALGVTGAVIVAAAVLWRWTARRVWVAITVAVLLGGACGAVATAARLAGRDAPAIAEPARAHATVTVEVTVRRDPVRLPRSAGPPLWLVATWLVRLEVAEAPPVRTRVRVLLFATDPAWQRLRPGDRVRAAGRLAPPRGADLTAAVVSVDGVPQRVGQPPWVQRAAESLRAGLRAAAEPLPDEVGGLVPALAVGDVSALDPSLSDDFFATGMTHLLAVSGSQCTIVVGFVFLLARAGRAPPWLTASLSGAAVVGFVILCQATASVVRAAAMGSIGLLALAVGRSRAAMPALAATVLILIAVDPELAGDAGFALSVVATAGLLLLAPRWRDGLRRRGVPAGLAEAVAVPAAAQVAVSPIIAGISGTVSLVAIAANLAAAPVVAPATVLGVLAAVVSPVWLPGGEFLAWLASWPAQWLVLVARVGARMPAAVVAWPGGWAGGLLLAVLTVAVLLAARHRLPRRLLAAGTAAVVAGAMPVAWLASGWPPAGAVVVACAVGQGDLIVVPVRAGEAIVVDAGPEPVAADRCLRDLGVSSVPLFVVSHFHADHVGGVSGVFRGRRVGAVLAAAWPEPEYGHRLVLEAAAAAGVQRWPDPQPGTSYRVGPVTLTVLAPPGRLTGTRSDPNNNSLVLRVEAAGVRVLLSGDAEIELQQALLTAVGPDALRADVLKVPHHGSAFQHDAFLAAVAPAVALVPVGEGNDYGHPDPDLLARLAATGARVLRTDVDGDVAAVSQGGGLAVVARGSP